jgi:hypothetical protein
VLGKLGLVDQEYRFTPLGERMERWVGQADLAYAVQLQKRFEESCNGPELMFWIVATALSNTPLATLKPAPDFFVDHEGKHRKIAHSLEVWKGYWHEDFALFDAVATMATMSPRVFFGGEVFDVLDDGGFYRWCNAVGFEMRKLLKAGKAIDDLWQLFYRINGKTARYEELFGSHSKPELARIPWIHCVRGLDVNSLQRMLVQLPGVEPLRLFPNEIGGFSWYDDEGRAGDITQDDTPVRLDSVYQYHARVVPSRKAKGEQTSWRLVHLTAFARPRPF